ncbi:MAG TPA: cytochrome c maturation protein CcmE [Anaerolineae bacterium]|nr:cytochrome c maturation protein CcmE [Anaerolineae bacterium]
MTESIVSQPKIAARNPNKKLKFIIGGLLIVVAIAYLGYGAIKNTGAYYIPLDELSQNPQAYLGKKIRVSGAIVQGSEDWDATNLMLRFKMTDQTGQEVLVSFHGSRPSNFSRATEAIVEGEIQSDGTFQADNLLLKCPSRYEEAPEVTEFEAMPQGQ